MPFGSVQIARVTGVVTASGTVSAAGVGAVAIGPNVGVVLGGAGAGAIYAPEPDDLVVVAKGEAGEDIITGSFVDPVHPPAWLPALVAGEFAIGNRAGAYLRFTAAGDIVLVPAPGRNVLLGTASAPIARVGDPVSASGSDPQGGTVNVTGTITSGSSEAKA